MRFEIKRGRLAEDGQTMVLPAYNGGEETPYALACYHAFISRRKGFDTADKLTYAAVPTDTTLEFGEREANIPFIQGGEVKDMRKIRVGRFQLTTHGDMTVIKIHPGVSFRISSRDGTGYHTFKILDTPEKYTKGFEVFDAVCPDERTALMERGERILRFPGATVYPDYCAFRLPGWLAKEFNGSPELGVGYSIFTVPRPGEALHHHDQTAEPQIVLRGKLRLFAERGGGEDAYEYVGKSGKRVARGDIFDMAKGDVAVFPVGVNHRILFEGAETNTEWITLNYSSEGLDKTPNDKISVE